jgi:sodium-coupled neutral amino acid transporter 9
MLIPCSISLVIKDISKIIKLAEYGVIAIFSYGFFIIYIFIKNLFSSNFNSKDIVYFTWNFSDPAGSFALAFMIHNSIGIIIQ